ncbi:MAG TPA: DNA polymerase III subunit beta [Nitrospirales bacterium]|jgi:DNA polymerase-3 subunit beta|nr:DNA polymerase III subunit beta [Nitrospirales bacterium]
MHIVISRKELLRGLHRVQGVVEKRNAMPILSNVLLETKEGGLEMFATDLEIGIRGFYHADVKKPGGAAVSARKLLEILKELPEADIVMATVEDSSFLSIRCGSSQFKIMALSPGDFPKMPVTTGKELPEIPAGLLARMLSKTTYAVGEHDTRYMLNGVNIMVEQVTVPSTKHVLRCVGTDGHRLAVTELDIGDASGTGDLRVIIPKKAAQEIKKLLSELDGEQDEEPRLGITDNQLVLRLSGLLLSARLIEGAYPDYEQVIPVGNDQKVTLDKKGFETAIRRVALLAPDRVNTIHLTFETDRVVLHSSTSDLGEATDELAAQYGGPGFEAVFNARYLLDALASIDGDQVVLELKGSSSPCLIHETGPVRTTCVVMPMKV